MEQYKRSNHLFLYISGEVQEEEKSMACLDLDSPQLLLNEHLCDGLFNLFPVGNTSSKSFSVPNSFKYQSTSGSIPPPPPLPARDTCGAKKYSKIFKDYCFVPKETREAWDKLFCEGYEADVRILTEDMDLIMAHSSILANASPILKNMLEQAKIKERIRKIKIPGVPSEGVRTFVRFLYSACYEPELIKKFVLHLLILSHAFAILSLKSTCIKLLEQELTTENVVDVLQLAQLCDAPQLSLVCTRLITKDLKSISVSEGWKTMKKTNPSLEQTLLESLVEEDSRRQDRMKRSEERKMYKHLHETMEALIHICRDGCRTIGPRSKMLKDDETICQYAACKGLESLIRHFFSCPLRVPGGCTQCKRMWQIFELHSQMCSELDLCKVPLCRHFKDKMKQLIKKEEHKWKLLVSKVMEAKGTISSISSRRLLLELNNKEHSIYGR
ncbi:BTB/POZ and TAZ domain-containing protein 3-like isoform X2 [Zingiber officinale]|uniref:BTB/POZ and TAZ domain-containing protein 3-like isoform X2 n=1 Tax=Zingiber officinale TaxID=94328 RepID=UPI001C4B0BBC|nr:BTB/POZ and TAZ domain-containing protein 3-like isoform X2 [Zingiber officinale]